MDSDTLTKPACDPGIIWAFGPRSRYAHAYPGMRGLDACVPLCGITCTPVMVADHFDIGDETIRRAACPDCLARLAFAKYMKPVAELYRERTGGLQR